MEKKINDREKREMQDWKLDTHSDQFLSRSLEN